VAAKPSRRPPEQAQARLVAQFESQDMNGDGCLASDDLGRQFGGF
jgi:hypothetical protein